MSDDNLTGQIAYTTFDLLFLSITVMVTLVLIISYTIKDIDNHEVELQNFIESTLQSTLVYQDPITKQYYPGIIDLEQFKNTNLSQEVIWEKPGATIKYEITRRNLVLATNYYVSHSNNDEQSYKRAQERMIEGGRFTYLSTQENPIIRNIAVIENGNYKHAQLRIVAAQET